MRYKKLVAGMALALGAAVAPMTTKASTETNTAPESVEIAQAEKARKLKEAIDLGLPRQDMLKYIDFPEWMPVTKEGKFSSKKSLEMFHEAGLDKAENQKILQEYMNDINAGVNPDVAFQKFAKQISGGDKEKMTKLNAFNEILKRMHEQNKGKFPSSFSIFAYSLVAIAALSVGLSTASMKDIGCLATALGLALAGVGVESGIRALDNSQYKSIYAVYDTAIRQVHRSYANQEIVKAGGQKIVKMSMEQAKQLIDKAKENN